MDFPLLSHKKGLRSEAVQGASGLHLVPNLLSHAEAQALIDYAHSVGFTHQGSRGPAHGEAFRDNGRVNVTDESAATELWHSTGLAHALRSLQADGWRATGLNPNLRFYRYEPGQRFGKHVDDSIDLGDGRHTRYTLLVYLSGDPAAPAPAQPPAAPQQANGKRGAAGKRGLQAKQQEPLTQQQQQQQQQQPEVLSAAAVQGLVGGETVFYGGPKGTQILCSIRPAPGLGLIHEHGQACLEHEAAAVRAGVKYLLRSDVVFEPA